MPSPLCRCAVLLLTATLVAGASAPSASLPPPGVAAGTPVVAGGGGASDEAPGDAQGTVIVPLRGDCPLRTGDRLFGDGEPSLGDACTALREVLTRAPEQRVVLDCREEFHPPLAHAEELAAWIRASKGAKHVILLLDHSDDRVLVLAQACDEVVMPEAGLLDVAGLSLTSYYFADALQRLGITFHAVISGSYKTAPEALTRSAPSPEGLQELHELVDGLDHVLLAEAPRAGLTAAQLTAARLQAPQPSAVAVATKLVDHAVEPDGWLQDQPGPVRTHKQGGHETPDLSSLGGILAFWNQLLSGEHAERQPKVVAVVELAGDIMEGQESQPGSTIVPDDTCKMLDGLAKDGRVVGVVVRIDSPGGDAEASDRIHHALARLAAKKPVVALFDAVAASGGYYIGCAAPEILVHHGTITGSIGVFAVAPDASGTLARLGITRVHVGTSPRSEVFSLAGWSEDKETALRAVVADTDRRFQALVAAQRHLPAATVAQLAGGRVYTGEQAVANKLADGYGSLLTAVERVRALAHEPHPLPLEHYPKSGGLLARLGLADTRLGVVPAQLALWAEIAARGQPAVLAWSNCVP